MAFILNSPATPLVLYRTRIIPEDILGIIRRDFNLGAQTGYNPTIFLVESDREDSTDYLQRMS